MRLDELTKLAKEIAIAYERKNELEGRPGWNLDNYMAGFMGDVGDLSKLVMARSGYRQIENVDERLAHELADCLWSILVIADELGLDLAKAYKDNMESLLKRVTSDRQSNETAHASPDVR